MRGLIGGEAKKLIAHSANGKAICGDVHQLIPFDEMLNTMYDVGRLIPYELKKTALSGCGTTALALKACGN